MKIYAQLSTVIIALSISAIGPFLAKTPLAASAADDVVLHEKDCQLELFADLPGPMLRGVTLSHQGRVFITFPRMDGSSSYTLAELKNDKPVPYPSVDYNKYEGQKPAEHLISVTSAIVDGKDRLWLIDSARLGRELIAGGTKLVGIDLTTNQVFQTIPLTSAVVTQQSILQDLRFDSSKGKEGVIYVSDCAPEGKSGIIVVDIGSGHCMRRLSGHASVQAEKEFLPFIHGRPMMRTLEDGKKDDYKVGVAGMAVKPDGSLLYYCPQASRQLYSVDARTLCDAGKSEMAVEQTVQDLGPKSGASDGLECDKEGNVYFTDFENSSVWKRKPNGTIDKVVHDTRLVWPDSLWIGHDGYLYVTSSQFNKRATFNKGTDRRTNSYQIYRLKVNATPRE
ncbi:MAG: SMP-30/gluconolactonase/LRE family protein [Cyanobacteria bacterium REEB67]|nr:SMP-30/gluconolactonase/LRE family protein [Cyanobacteria bacterium REEB67]